MRLPQFSLRTILVIVSVASMAIAVMACIGQRYYQHRALIAQLKELNGSVGINQELSSYPTSIHFTLQGLPCLVDDRAVAEIVPLLAYSDTIRYLGLTNSPITDDAVRLLVDALGSRLIEIELSGTSVTSTAIMHLADASNLKSLSIPYSALTPDSLAALASMDSLKALRMYSVAAEEDPLRESLRQAIPAVEVTYHRRASLYD